MKPALIYEFAKGRDLVRLEVSEFKGRRVTNIRIWYRQGDEWKPGRAGVTFSAEHLRELYEALGAYLAGADPDGSPST